MLTWWNAIYVVKPWLSNTPLVERLDFWTRNMSQIWFRLQTESISRPIRTSWRQRSHHCKISSMKVSYRNECTDIFCFVYVCILSARSTHTWGTVIAALMKLLHFKISIQQDCRMKKMFLNITYRIRGQYENLNLTIKFFDITVF